MLTNNNYEEKEELKNQFLTILSHELRTPMTITKGYISMLLEGIAGELNPKAKEFLQEIYDGNERLIKLVNDMEKVVQIDTHELHFDIKPVSIFAVAAKVVGQLSQKAKEKKLDIILTIPDDPFLSVLADQTFLYEVIHCLVENAIKFTDEGEIVISEEQAVINGRKSLVIKVKDTGIGIPEGFHRRIFGKFAHVNFTLTDQRGGTGLGLYIAKELLESMEGTIWVESKEKEGSTFFFSLPLALGKTQ
jgi:signal transduction histidine kinase